MSPLPLISGVEVTIDGDPLDSTLAANLLEVRADQRFMLPAAFLIRIADPRLEHIDSSPFSVGAQVEIRLAAAGGDTLELVLSGQIAAVEPEFGRHGAVLAARGYDQSHTLNRTRTTATYQNMSSDDIAAKVADRAGLDAGTIDSAGDVHDFVQQNNETDWEFLWRVARRIDYEVSVDQGALNFRELGGDDGDDPPVLRWGDDLWTFRPRVTGVQQVDDVVVRAWDPSSKQVIESRQSAGTPDADIGIERDDVGSALGGGSMTMADRPVLSSDEADALATSMASRLGKRVRRGRGHLPRRPHPRGRDARADRRRRPALRRRLHPQRDHPRLPRRPGLRDPVRGHRPLAAQPGRPAQPGARGALGRLGGGRDRDPEQRSRRHGPRARALPRARRRHRGLVGADRRTRRPGASAAC